MNVSENVMIDEDKLKKYAPILCSTYESLFEINLTTGIINTVFYNGGTKEAKSFYKTKDLKNTLVQTIKNRDRKKINSFFSKSTFKDILKNGYSSRAEFGMMSNEGDSKSLRMCLTPYYGTVDEIILCCNYIIKSDNKDEKLMRLNADFNNLFRNTYRSIFIIDLKTGLAAVYKNADRPETEGEVFNWNSYIKEYEDNLVCINDKKIVNENFYISGLTDLYEKEKNEFCANIRRKTDESPCFWVEIGVKFGLTNDGIKVYFTERDSDEIHLLHAIVDKFVYKNCDYFIYLDVNNNSYTMINYNERGMPLPPIKSSDYSGDILGQINKYVDREEREQVIENLRQEKIIKHLETSDEFIFSFGIITENGEYRRKLIKYVYYDKHNKMVLLIRDDITEQYLEYMAGNDRLNAALECAQRDSLTQIYNRKFVKEHINNRLAEMEGRLSALLFIDLDDFKAINDNLGHSEGDNTLKIVAEALNKSVRHTDVVGRFGGDEFVIFLSCISSKGEVLRCVERIFRCFDNIYTDHVQNKNIANFSCSIGIAFSPENGENFDVLVERADMALYKAKRMGKNCCSIYSENIQYQ
ncbi:MAG: GGDEF domain-containing protein [Candidatus Metalachnospira sp.]|nr:GGDEF domain-containing protein [Candidatus Metalachnospira sp.]